ncbi:MAG: hypothetical protein HXY41_13845 [Chloroflexi bacterium]|nr:hypothetical protein [Chloroflexota bacterium]
MSKEKLTQARDLMQAGKYRQARAALKGIKGTTAEKMLARLDQLEASQPRRTRASSPVRDLLHILLMAVIFTALFGGGAFFIANQLGIKAATGASALLVADGGTPIPTATPRPTETPVPCDAQLWWDEHRAGFRSAIGDSVDLSIELPPTNIQSTAENFKLWRQTFEAETVAPCLEPLKQATVAALPQVEAYINAFLNVTTAQERALLLLPLIDGLLPLADAITNPELGITLSPDDAWVTRIQDFSRAECPVNRWIIETFYARNYARFFDLTDQLQIQNAPLADVQFTLREMRNLRSAFETDSAAFPDCVKPASEHFLKGMDAFINTVNATLNNDPAAADAYLAAAQTEFNAFSAEMNALSPTVSTDF